MRSLILALALLLMAVTVQADQWQNCEEWANCNMNSPNFNGICCRICENLDYGWREWQCFRMTSDQGFSPEVERSIPWFDEAALEEDGLFQDYMIMKRRGME